ncbi:MAG TPA: DUF4340 domain-containing protein [Hyphomicrobiales bacterium]|nr:DUF4340 domain-containing protein [Hyphomicrobiales bacterium]
MTTKLLWLGGILAAQLLLSAGLLLNDLDGASQQAPQNLLSFAPLEADRLVVDDRTNTATLTRVDDGWQLSDLANLPANAPKVNGLLGNLEDLTTRWPVVNTASGRERFEVNEDNYQRRLAFYQGDQLLGTYYFGTSPGFRQTHVRRDGEDDVYAVAFNNFDLPTDANDWLDKALLAVTDPTRIAGPDYTLVKQDDTWALEQSDTADGSTLKTSTADALERAWNNLRVLRVADNSVPAAAKTTAVTVANNDGSWRYTFNQTDNACFVQREDINSLFTLTNGDCDQLGGTRRAGLVDMPATTGPAEHEDHAAEPSAKG